MMVSQYTGLIRRLRLKKISIDVDNQQLVSNGDRCLNREGKICFSQ